MVSLQDSQVDDRIEAFKEMYVRLSRAHGERILARHHMTMRDAAPFAADIAIMELVSDEEWLIRLSGTNLCRRANRDRTGTNVLQGRSKAERNRRKTIVDQLFMLPCGGKSLWKERFGNDMTATTASITLPSFGRNGELLIMSYELLVGGMEWAGFDHPSELNAVDLLESEFVDLGFGVPE